MTGDYRAVASRRGFLFGVGASLICAPAIVRAASLMPVRAPKLVIPQYVTMFDFGSWRLDVLYGVTPLDNRLIPRIASAEAVSR